MKHDLHFILLPVFALAFICSGVTVNSFQTRSHYGSKDSLFDMCSVMPGDEVAALSPFNKPIKQTTSLDRLDGFCGCHYDLQSDDDFPQVQISVNQFSSPATSKEDFAANKQDWVNLYQRQPEFISNLGDSAMFCGNAEPGKCDDCGLQVASGKYYITVAFKGYYEKITARSKQESAIRIVKKLFEKKPFLNSRRQ